MLSRSDMTRLKREGDKIHPCFHSIAYFKYVTLIFSKCNLIVNMFIDHCQHVHRSCAMPFLGFLYSTSVWIALQSSMSKAFNISRKARYDFPFWLFGMAHTLLSANMLSSHLHPLWKAPWIHTRDHYPQHMTYFGLLLCSHGSCIQPRIWWYPFSLQEFLSFLPYG